MTLAEIYETTIRGDRKRVESLVGDALGQGAAPATILDNALKPAMDEVGRLFAKLELYLPEMMAAAEAMRVGVGILRPLLADSRTGNAGHVVLGTVKGDIHNIGKDLVAMMLDGAGFRVVDLGEDVSSDEFVAFVTANEIDILGMSAMLTTTKGEMRTTIQALDRAGARGQLKVIVGGAPLTQEFADDIGADGYAPDAVTAVGKVRKLIGIDVPRIR